MSIKTKLLHRAYLERQVRHMKPKMIRYDLAHFLGIEPCSWFVFNQFGSAFGSTPKQAYKKWVVSAKKTIRLRHLAY